MNSKKIKKYVKNFFLVSVTFALFLQFGIISALANTQHNATLSIRHSSDPEIFFLIMNGKYIDIDLSSQIMTLYENGKVKARYTISSGKNSTPTPKGTFKVYSKSPKAWSEKYDLYMPYWMAFTPSGSYGIHELPEWKNGTKEGADHLGIPVSHGCVRLGIGAAKQVYKWAPIGTPIVIH